SLKQAFKFITTAEILFSSIIETSNSGRESADRVSDQIVMRPSTRTRNAARSSSVKASLSSAFSPCASHATAAPTAILPTGGRHERGRSGTHAPAWRMAERIRRWRALRFSRAIRRKALARRLSARLPQAAARAAQCVVRGIQFGRRSARVTRENAMKKYPYSALTDEDFAAVDAEDSRQAQLAGRGIRNRVDYDDYNGGGRGQQAQEDD